ncbi:MAG: hypothetical protein ACLP5H_22720 [Desulfomonilaceae bacterium]
MVKGASVGRCEARSKELGGANYDYVKTVIAMAKKNGWDLESLGLIPKDLPISGEMSLSRKQVTERNRLVKSIFRRFSSILTPPIPSDLEQLIRSKDAGHWLPWEKEVIEKIGQWRDEIAKIRPEILNELGRALAMKSTAQA